MTAPLPASRRNPKPPSPAAPAGRPSVRPPARADQRLAKRVAELKGCSRSEAEQYIEGGWVRVDGQVVEDPPFRVLHQRIEIDPQASLLGLGDVTLLLNKPPGMDAGPRLATQFLTPATHVAQDPAGQRVLKRHLNKLVCPVPLETGATGLLVYTQDWRVQRKLEEDAHLMEHELIVEVASEVADDTLRRLGYAKGSDGGALPAFKVSLNSSGEGKSKLRFAIKGSHPGLVAWLCDRVALQILGMKRIRIGRVALSGVPVGQWRYLGDHERF